MNVNLRQLKGFLLLARLGNFTRAAEQMHVSQAGLSAMMRELEGQFDCRLFDRTTRSVTLTREGERLVSTAELVVGQLEEAAIAIAQSVHTTKRFLTVAVTPVVGAGLMPPVFSRFAEVNPSVTVRLVEVPRQEIQSLVERGTVDVGFGIFTKPATGTSIEPLFTFDLMYVSAQHASASVAASKDSAIPEMRWHDLPDETLLSLTSDSLIQTLIDEQLAEIGKSIPQRVLCESIPTLIGFIGEGLGAGILPSFVLAACPATKYSIHRLVEPSTSLDYHYVIKNGRPLSDTAKQFIEVVSDLVSEFRYVRPV